VTSASIQISVHESEEATMIFIAVRFKVLPEHSRSLMGELEV
jgi:hypothetical protein